MLNPIGRALLIALLPLTFNHLNAEDYTARFKQLKDQKADGAQIDSLLDEWRAKSPNDPDAWITSANYYFNQSVGPTISTKAPGKGDFALTSKKTGKQAGSISFKPNVGQTSRDAATILQEATTKFPDRLDIWCGLSWMYQETGDFDKEFATLQKMVAYVREHPTELKWLKGEPIPGPADQFVPDKLHSYGVYYEKKENPEDDKRMLKIATFSAEQFPNHPYAFNDVAVYYSINKDFAQTREWLEKAHQADPKDGLVLYNLGYASEKLGDKKAAQKWYEESLKAAPDDQYTQKAKQALAKLKRK
ncbi:MAG TPA: tetratricopeptide repeat protein [Chthoniobacterales bacterium]|nr:tetratricopeptide repeat protein [Chthoniobacterales bacterium]